MLQVDGADNKIQLAEFEAYMLSITAGSSDEEFLGAMREFGISS